MIKVLWVVNLMLPDIAKELGMESSVREGWLTGLFRSLKGSVDLTIAYPVKTYPLPSDIRVGDALCCAFYEDLDTPYVYDASLEEKLRQIIEKCSPDIVHIFGTEFPHALACARAFGRPERILTGIQGLCSKIAEDYYAMLPDKVVQSRTLRDILRKDSIAEQKEKFSLRAENEQKAIKLAGHITGRTGFDKETTLNINPRRIYHHMDETMRKEFYEGKWDLSSCQRHSIFVSQGDYPIKGLHFVIEAAGGLIKEYPDLTIRVAGNDITGQKGLKGRIKIPAYGKYIKKLIKENGLTGAVTMTGALDGPSMKKTYLGSSVFICSSYVENSPNTLAEAMLLGVPVIASNAGGIPDMISDKEGIIFEKGDVSALKEAIKSVFDSEDTNDPELSARCDNAVSRARRVHDGSKNAQTLIGIYNEMIG